MIKLTRNSWLPVVYCWIIARLIFVAILWVFAIRNPEGHNLPLIIPLGLLAIAITVVELRWIKRGKVKGGDSGKI